MQLALAAIIVLGALSHWLAWRLKLPAILFLLVVGLLLGPAFGLIRPDELFGESLFGLVSLAVAVILFEGSLTLRWSELREVGPAVWGLVSVGALITYVAIALSAHWVMLLSWPVSFMLGAICSVTGPTVVVPMLRAIRPISSISTTLRWEGIVIDPIGAMLAVLTLEFIRTRDVGTIWLAILHLIATGMFCGLAGAFLLGWLLRRHLIPWYLRDVCAMAFVVAAFAGANWIAHEAGLLAVTVMGVVLANMKRISVDDILEFKESLTLLLVAILFITLAARLDFADFASMNWRLAVFLALVMLVIRPLAVFASTNMSRLNWREKLLISWISPRGIVAAVVGALFAIELVKLDVTHADLIVPIVFAVIMTTVVVQSATAKLLARRLGLATPEPNGIIILGASAANRAFARKLAERQLSVLIADDDWGEVRKARMDGLQTYFGRIVSDHAEGVIDHGNIGYLFGMSDRAYKNLLACVHFRPELGADSVFVLDVREVGTIRSQEVVGNLKVARLFGSDFHLGEFDRLVDEGGEFRVTRMTSEFGFQDYRDSVQGEFIPLLGIDPGGRLHPFTDQGRPTIRAGWHLMALIPKPTLDNEQAARARAAEARAAGKSEEGADPAFGQGGHRS